MRSWLVSFGGVLLVMALTPTAEAKVHTQDINFKVGEKNFSGYVAWDDAVAGTRPGVLVIPDWMGLGDFPKKKAEELASMGYVALAADMYGVGKTPRSTQEASALSGALKADPVELRARVDAAFETLRSQKLVDPQRTAAIGFCFGGTTVLELARSGAPVSGVVSFHGGLTTKNPAEPKAIRAKVLVLHGADDPFAPPADVQAFENEMRAAGADWQLVAYGGAVHGFTNPAAGSDNSKGVAYNEKAARRSWEAMKAFFLELWGPVATSGGRTAA